MWLHVPWAPNHKRFECLNATLADLIRVVRVQNGSDARDDSFKKRGKALGVLATQSRGQFHVDPGVAVGTNLRSTRFGTLHPNVCKRQESGCE